MKYTSCLVLLLLVCGCASSQLSLRVQGVGDNEHFRAKISRDGKHLTDIRTRLTGDAPSVVFITNKHFGCDVRKIDPDTRIVVEILEGAESAVFAEVPVGSAGVRIERIDGQWKKTLY